MASAAEWFARADDASARVGQQVAAAQERAATAAQVRVEMDRLRGQARSRRGEVTVTTDATGRVVDLRFADDALELSARDLSRLTLETIEASRAASGAAALDLARAAWGEDSSTVAALATELSRSPRSADDR